MDPVVLVPVRSELRTFPLLGAKFVLVGQLAVQHRNRATREQFVIDGTLVLVRVINSELGSVSR
jgi:hypothetical protein